MTELALSTNTSTFLLSALKQGCRVDGRSKYELRHVSFDLGQRGHAVVSLGQTCVRCAVSCELVEPYPERPTEGFYSFTVTLSAMASPEFADSFASSAASVQLARMLERCLRDSRAVDTEALCVLAGKKVWAVRFDVTVMNDDGNLADTAMLATLAALLHFRRPAFTIEDDSVTVYSADEREPVAIPVHHLPICVTFALFNHGQDILVDPCLTEDSVKEGTLTFAVNAHGDVCSVSKPGGCAVDLDAILASAKIAGVKALELTDALNAAVQAAQQAWTAGRH